MVRALSVLFGALFALVGCSNSLNPRCAEDSFGPLGTATVTGRVLRADGSPQADLALKLVRCPSFDLIYDNSFQTTATTDAEGSFKFQVSSGNASSCFRLETQDGEHVLKSKFGIRRSSVDVPELRPWKGDVSSAEVEGGLRIQWVDLKSSHGYAAPSAKVEITTPSGGDAFPVWKAFGAWEGALDVPPRLLENVTNLTASVSLRSIECGAGTTFQRDYTTPSARVAAPTSPTLPVSRGKPCTTAPNRVEGKGCPITAGNFRFLETSSFLNAARAESVTIDLGEAKTIRHAVLRGLSMPYSLLGEDKEPLFDHQFELLSSQDGSSFQRIAGPFKVADESAVGCSRDTIAGNAECYADIALEDAAPARFFQLAIVQNTPKDHNGQGNPATISSLTQFSLFE